MRATHAPGALPDDLDRPVVVVGAPRCGTTFLATLLGCHPDLAVAHEPRLTWRYGNDRKSDLLTAVDARPEVRAHIRRNLASFVHAQSSTRLVEKTPSNSLRLDFVDAVLPDARYVHVIRDGRDAVASIVQRWRGEGKTKDSAVERHRLLARAREASPRQWLLYAGEAVRRLLPESRLAPPLWGPRLPGMAALVNEIGVLGVAALQWRTCIERARWFGRHFGSRYMEVRLEDLSAEVIAQVVTFAELPDEAVFQHEFSARFRPSGASRHMLTADEHDVVEAWIATTQASLGYQ